MAISPHQRKKLNSLLHELVRKRDGARCLKCGRTDTLQLSHIYPKGRYRNLEFDPLNVKLLCNSCHLFWWHKDPLGAKDWLDTVMPQARLEWLKARSNIHGDKSMRDYNLLKIMIENEISLCKPSQ